MDSGENRPQGNVQAARADILAAVVHSCVRSYRLVRNLSTSKEGTMAAANLMSLIGKSKSCQSLTSSGNPPGLLGHGGVGAQGWRLTPDSGAVCHFCMSLSEGSGSGNLSTSSSCSETYTSFSDIKP